MNKYELMYIIDMKLDEAPRKELVARINALITDNGGTIDKIDEWGKRRLAYTIDYRTEGYYVLVNFTAGGDLPREIERVLQISDDVLRYLIVRLEEKHTSVKPRAIPLRPVLRPPVYIPEGDITPVPIAPVAAPASVAAAPAAEAPVEAVAAPVEAAAAPAEAAQTEPAPAN